MTDDPIFGVAIIGTGQMGPAIAVATTLVGCPTTLIDRTALSFAAWDGRGYGVLMAWALPAPVTTSQNRDSHSLAIRVTAVDRAARDVRRAALSRGGNDGKSGLEARPMLPQLGLAQVNLVVPAHAMPA